MQETKSVKKDQKNFKKKKIEKKKPFKQMKPNLDLEEHKPMKQSEKTKQNLEKEVLIDPNNSQKWIELVTYVIEQEGIEEGRLKMKEAFRNVSFDNEKEKINLWKANLNLEYFYGDQDEFVEIFKQSIGACDRIDMIKHVTSLYLQDNKYEEAEDIVKLALRKSVDKKQSWLIQLEFLIQWREHLKFQNESTEQIENKIKETLKRSLQSINKNDHVYFLTHYSNLEYKAGNFEIARVNYENIITNFPKKSDVWNMYIDMEIKYVGELDNIRFIFDRLLSQPLKEKLAKQIFKKYLNFEIQSGDSKSQEKVKQKAIDFINKQSNQLKVIQFLKRTYKNELESKNHFFLRF